MNKMELRELNYKIDEEYSKICFDQIKLLDEINKSLSARQI